MTLELHRQFEYYSPYKMLQELKSMFDKQAGVEKFDLIQTFCACKQEEGKPVSPYVIKMKNYVAQLERLGYVLPQDLSVGLIMASLYEKGLPKKAATPQVTAIQGGRIQKANKKLLNAKGKDRAGEYISQKFKDYFKACRIVQQLTPPYTPELSGMSERRNHTLLDMVGSMMNLTTLPLSFWDYALETATHILNMVPTKKVDKTPYELWYAEFLEKNFISQEVSGRARELEEIQDEDTSPSENTSEIPMELEGFEPPQEEVVPVHRVDCAETFSHVADIRAIRILIAIAAFYDYKIWQMDVKTAFFNGYVNEDIYMVQPEGFVDPNHSKKVCKLQRPIYGLKQASRSWNKRFDEEIKMFGF
uniref:Retrotransposon protein, putative, Ty1-copia subclass n=1 Tax=Tanacetum cinerariifolium TaxID=118510 RepID=A0A6L2LPF0_TANCI|nr:retrotransposon protein, putative, Ty1-copia subclass [Tanacetum cinerariifolium]